jgi:hypothetical protein
MAASVDFPARRISAITARVVALASFCLERQKDQAESWFCRALRRAFFVDVYVRHVSYIQHEQGREFI